MIYFKPHAICARFYLFFSLAFTKTPLRFSKISPAVFSFYFASLPLPLWPKFFGFLGTIGGGPFLTPAIDEVAVALILAVLALFALLLLLLELLPVRPVLLLETGSKIEEPEYPGG